MAIKKTRDFKGVTITDAYNKVSDLTSYKTTYNKDILDDESNVVAQGSVTEYRLNFICSTRANSSSEEIFREGYDCTYNLEGDNNWIQAYSYLMSLPDFSGGIEI